MTTPLRRRIAGLSLAFCTLLAPTALAGATATAATTSYLNALDVTPNYSGDATTSTDGTPPAYPIYPAGYTSADSALLAAMSSRTNATLRTLTQDLSPVPDATPDALHISLTSITPNIIDGTTNNQVTINGTLTNVGKLPISDIELRLQRGDYAPYGNALRHTLVEDQINYPTALPFHSLNATLRPGATTTFTLKARITGGTGDTLNIHAPGVYPLLINANGRVSKSDSARLHDARILLPVLSLPGTTSQDPAQTAPRPITLLWPLATTPQEASYDSFSSVAVLRNENLGISLAKNGRLRALLDTGAALLGDRTLGNSVCLAVDPDLLRTVNRMTRPYRVLNNPTNRHDGVHKGKHSGDAQTWLDHLRGLAANSCVIALPWAGASLSATAHSRGDALPHQLMVDSRAVTSYLLRTRLSSHVIWPNVGMVTTADLAAADHPELLLASNALTSPNPYTRDAQHARTLYQRNPKAPLRDVANSGYGQWFRADGTTYTVTPFDSTLATALATTGQNPTNSLFGPSDSRYLLTADSATARMQDAVATLLWKTSANLRRENLATNSYPDAPLIIAPPQHWSVTGSELKTFTDTLRYLARHNLITTQSLTDALAQSKQTPRHGTLNTDQFTSMPLPNVPLATVDRAVTTINRYHNVFANKGDNSFYKRARYNIYRATTTRTWGISPTLVGNVPTSHNNRPNQHQGSPGIALTTPPMLGYPTAYARSMALAGHAMRGSVTLIKPASIYTLASTDSDLVLVARNELPADVTVTVHTLQRTGDGDGAPTGPELAPARTITIPAQASLNVNIPVQLPSGTSVPVRVSLLSADGQELGTTVNMTVRVSRLTPLLGFLLFAAIAVLAFLILKRVLPLIRRSNGQGRSHE